MPVILRRSFELSSNFVLEVCFFTNSVNIHAGKITVHLLSGNFRVGILQQDAEIDFTGDKNSSFTRPWAGGLIQVNKGKAVWVEEVRIGKKIRTMILPVIRMWKSDPFVVPVMWLCRQAGFG